MGDLVNLSSERGKALLAEVCDTNGPYQPFLHSIFSKQVGRKNCGITSAALVKSAAELGKSRDIPNPLSRIDIEKESIPFTEDSFFEIPEVKNVITQEKLLEIGGLTLDKLCDVLKAGKCGVMPIEADSCSIEDFRTDSIMVLHEKNSSGAVIVNYHMETLGQCQLAGHHSPLVAYHKGEDRFLLLDTWPDTESCWVRTEDLFRAMKTVDDASNKSRGYILVEIE